MFNLSIVCRYSNCVSGFVVVDSMFIVTHIVYKWFYFIVYCCSHCVSTFVAVDSLFYCCSHCVNGCVAVDSLFIACIVWGV